MKKRVFFLIFPSFVGCLFFASCKQAGKSVSFESNDISHVITQMTDLMVHDITNPPLASRFFSYACLAGYEVVSENNNKYPGMHGVLNRYPEIKRPDSITGYSYQLAALLAMLETAKKMQPSGRQHNKYEDMLIDSCKKAGIDEDVIANSKRYAVFISSKILAYAKADGYNKISTRQRYVPINKPGCWYPTPPGYFDAVEPYFNTVRPFVLDSASEMMVSPPVTFDSTKGSPFYKLADAVYKEGNNVTLDHRVIASFWDCNPFAMQDEGHLQYGFKKISPGAHWLGITGIVCANSKKDFDESMKIFTTVSIGLMDAFMTCWDEKFRSNRIRPETAIRKYINPTWQPLLQTPPFPEYLSGHSVISSASATILSHYVGDNVRFTDSVEVTYGLPARSFESFKHAANEAAISRFYGGIHYMDAIENGLVQGQRVGEKVIAKMK
jgi:PAP2 superfamily